MMLLIQTPPPAPPDPVIIGQFPFPETPTPPWESLPPGVFLLVCLAFVKGNDQHVASAPMSILQVTFRRHKTRHGHQ